MFVIQRIFLILIFDLFDVVLLKNIFFKIKDFDVTLGFVLFFFSFRQLNIKKVLVSGGSLDHRVAPQVLKEGGAEKVSILALNEAGRVSNYQRAVISSHYRSDFFYRFLVISRSTISLSKKILFS